MNLTRNTKEECVMARIMRNCITHQKNFSIKDFGSWEAAEAAGRKWVNKQKKILPASRMNEVGRMTKRNKSGVAGVFITRSIRRKPSGNEYEYWKWIARWPGCPIRCGITWTINDETPDDDAFALACLSREMCSIDREKVRGKLADIYGSEEHLNIMKKKQVHLI